MSHSRKNKDDRKPLSFKKIGSYDFKTKIGVFNVEEYKSFYIVKKKLQHPSQKGFYDPTAMVVAKQGKIPFIPQSKFGETFGWFNPFFFYYTGVEGKDHFKEEMRKISSGKYLPLGTPAYFDKFLHLEKLETKAEKVGDVLYVKLHHEKR